MWTNFARAEDRRRQKFCGQVFLFVTPSFQLVLASTFLLLFSKKASIKKEPQRSIRLFSLRLLFDLWVSSKQRKHKILSQSIKMWPQFIYIYQAKRVLVKASECPLLHREEMYQSTWTLELKVASKSRPRLGKVEFYEEIELFEEISFYEEMLKITPYLHRP